MGINAFVAYEVFAHGSQCIRCLWCAMLHMGMNAFVAYEVIFRIASKFDPVVDEQWWTIFRKCK